MEVGIFRTQEMSAEKLIALKTNDGRYFSDWIAPRKRDGEPTLRFGYALSTARGFEDELLAEAFQKFFKSQGIETHLCIVAKSRLLEQFTPQPRSKTRIVANPQVNLVDLKARLRGFRS